MALNKQGNPFDEDQSYHDAASQMIKPTNGD